MGFFRINNQNLKNFIRVFEEDNTRKDASTRAGAEHVTLIQEAFEDGGVDPKSGSPGKWPDKKVPSKADVAANLAGKKRLFDKTPRLQDTGALVQGINFKATDKGYKIGPTKGGDYAAVHQFGMKIKVSTKMRGFLFARGFRLKKATKTVTIPARPFIVMPDPWKVDIAEAYYSSLLEAAGNAARSA